MTPEEQTEAAIAAVKQKAPVKKKTEIETKKDLEDFTAPKENEKAEKAEETEEPTVNMDEFPFVADLGSKTVNFKAWTGKTKKKFKNLFKKLTEESALPIDGILRVLVQENLSNPDIYLSAEEQQFVMALMRKASLQDEYTFEGVCPKCQHSQTVETSVTESLKFVSNKFPANFKHGKFRDINSKSELEDEIAKAFENDIEEGFITEVDIENALHIQFKNVALTPTEIIEKLDEMTLKDVNDLQDGLSEASASFSLTTLRKCENCKANVNFSTEEIPELFDSLLY